MEKKLLKKDKLSGIVKKMAADKTVYAPVKDEDNVLLKVLEPGMEPLASFANTKNAPKKVFFPHSELLLKYTRSPKGMVFAAMPADEKEFVLFGVRPCDARSFALLDMLFDQEKWKDPYYIEKRRRGTVISLACVHPPYAACFCTSVDGSPTSTQGSDIQLTDLGENWLVEFLTPKGEALASWFGEATPADAAAEAKKQAIAEQSAAEIKKKIPGRAIKPILDVSFEHPFWDTIYGKCLACGTCTYMCPTCHCFDISDEVKGDDGVRIRNWDSCMFPLFTKETSGHNPRTSQKQRWRQRLMHKFKYYVDNFDAIACVGCGRCVMSCPVNIDIRKIVEDISKLQD